MASGDPVLQVKEIWVPTSLFAVLTRRTGGSTPAEGINVWNFDPGPAIWYLDFLCELQKYAGGGLTFTLPWMAATATTGVTRWGIAIHRLSTADDVDISHTYDFNVLDATAPATSGFTVYSALTFTDGADMDSWANGEYAIVRVRREANHANDTMSGYAQLLGLSGRES